MTGVDDEEVGTDVEIMNDICEVQDDVCDALETGNARKRGAANELIEAGARMRSNAMRRGSKRARKAE